MNSVRLVEQLAIFSQGETLRERSGSDSEAIFDLRSVGTSVTRKGHVRYPHERLHQALWWMNKWV